jgi:hypothetical protein
MTEIKPECAKKYDAVWDFPEFLNEDQKTAFEKINLIKFLEATLYYQEKENITEISIGVTP